jgi:hypothetical protein
MANKLYIDYPPGSYDTSKIFLQADSTTGQLEKINLPSIQVIEKLSFKLNQSGTSQPDYYEQYNNTGLTFTCTRSAVGLYILHSSAPYFGILGTICIIGSPQIPLRFFTAQISGTQNILIRQFDIAGNPIDELVYLPVSVEFF